MFQSLEVEDFQGEITTYGETEIVVIQESDLRIVLDRLTYRKTDHCVGATRKMKKEGTSDLISDLERGV